MSTIWQRFYFKKPKGLFFYETQCKYLPAVRPTARAGSAVTVASVRITSLEPQQKLRQNHSHSGTVHTHNVGLANVCSCIMCWSATESTDEYHRTFRLSSLYQPKPESRHLCRALRSLQTFSKGEDEQDFAQYRNTTG